MNQNLDELDGNTSDGVRGLCAAIVLGAVEDWRKLYSQQEFYVPGEYYLEAFLVNRSELREFFKSAWFEILCDALELNAQYVLRKLNVTNEIPYWREKWNARRRELRRERRKEKKLLRGAR